MMDESERDTARYHTPGRPALFSDRPVKQSPPLTWPHVGLVAVIALAMVAVAFACAWGIKG
jgi:hypothetical protein